MSFKRLVADKAKRGENHSAAKTLIGPGTPASAQVRQVKARACSWHRRKAKSQLDSVVWSRISQPTLGFAGHDPLFTTKDHFTSSAPLPSILVS